MQIRQMPNGHEIKGWAKVFDRVTYKFELVEQGHYSNKEYESPGAQEDEVPFAKPIQDYIDRVLEVISIKQLKETFAKQIPFESYGGGSSVVVKVLASKRQLRAYKKERDAYRKQHHITGKNINVH